MILCFPDPNPARPELARLALDLRAKAFQSAFHMRLRHLLFTASLVTLFGCGNGVVSGDINLPPGSWAGSGGPPPTRQTTEVTPGEKPPVSEAIATPRVPTALGLLNGLVIVGDGAGLWATHDDDTVELRAADVRAEMSAPSTVSSVLKMGYRLDGGLYVVAPEGLFHSHETSFFRSPVSDVISPARIRALNGVGTGLNEQLWVAFDTHTEVFSNGASATLKLGDLPPPDFAAGLTVGTGFLGVGKDLYVVQLSPARAALRLEGIGPVLGSVWSDGILVMTTAEAVVRASPAGNIDISRFEHRGAALPIRAVSPGAGGLHVLAGNHLMRASGKSWTHVAEIAGATGPMTVDAWGQAWIHTSTGLQRVRSGEAVGFSQVEPFLVQHCIMCHDQGVDGAPVIDFLDYDVAKEWAPRILARVSDAQSPMPPRRIAILLPEDWSLVKRWVEGGALP